jgi:hypothetical protein
LNKSSLTGSTADALLSRQEGIQDTLPVYDSLSDSSDNEGMDPDEDSAEQEIYELTMTEMMVFENDDLKPGLTI